MDCRPDHESTYRASCRRHVKTARKAGYTHECQGHLFSRAALEHFKDNPEYRDGIRFETFRSLVNALAKTKAANVHIVRSSRGHAAAVAVVLCSHTVANIRFVASNPSDLKFRTVNLLYHDTIRHYSGQNFDYVDLSGFSHSQSKKLIGINQFKSGFSKTMVEFEKVAL